MKKRIKNNFENKANGVSKEKEMKNTINNVVALYDKKTKKVRIIESAAYAEGRVNEYTVVNKLSDLNSVGRVFLANLGDFIEANPNSAIERYIAAEHSEEVLSNFEKYVVAYICMYRLYESFATLVQNGYVGFIDSFIDSCCLQKTDHPMTICYFKHEMHKVLKLRKAVFKMFKEEMKEDYELYKFILVLHENGYRDKQFRELRKKSRREIQRAAYAIICGIENDCGNPNTYVKGNIRVGNKEASAA